MYDISKSSESDSPVNNAETMKDSSGTKDVAETLTIKYRQTASIYKKFLRVGQRSAGCGACGHTSPD